MNDLTVQTGIRDWLMMMGYGNNISSQFTVTHGVTVSQAQGSLATQDSGSDPLARWVPNDAGLLITDVMADNCTPGLDYIDFALVDANHYRIYLPSSPQTIPINILSRGDPAFSLVSGESSNSIYVTIHAISLDRSIYNWILAHLAPDKPFQGTQGAFGEKQPAQ